MDKFIKTKLSIPPVRKDTVVRGRLLDLLDSNPQLKLSIVCASAGFGKTTLISNWAHRKQARGDLVAWMTTDESDQDPGKFWGYAIEAMALQSVPLKNSLIFLQTPKFTKNIDAFLAVLVNEIADFDQKINLVIDDYHMIESTLIHSSLSYLLKYLPVNAHLVLLSRTDIPIYLTLLRARNQVMEVSSADLRFTIEETRQFLVNGMRLHLTEGQLALLGKYTEGWVAGLQMAGLSIKRQKDPDAYIETFAADDRLIFEFLADEVLKKQPDHIQEFLLKTSVLNSFCAPLCNYLTEQQDASEILQQLETDNLFLNPIEQHSEIDWYSYHPLFSNFLKDFLSKKSPGILQNLYSMTAEWFADNDNYEESIEYSLKAKKFHFAAGLMDTIAESFYGRGRWTTLINWLEQIPKNYIALHPHVYIIYAWILAALGDIDEAGKILETVEKNVGLNLEYSLNQFGGKSLQGASKKSDDQKVIMGELAAIRATIARVRGEFEKAINLSQEAISHLPEYHFAWFPAKMNYAHALRLNDCLEMAVQEYTSVVQDAHVSGQFVYEIAGMSYLAPTRMIQGKMHLAADIYDTLLAIAHKYNFQQAESMGICYIGLADLHRVWGQMEKANQYFQTGIQIALKEWQRGVVRAGYLNLDNVLRSLGGQVGALKSISDALNLTVNEGTLINKARIEACQALTALRKSEFGEVMTWSLSAGFDLSASPKYVEELKYNVLARFDLKQGRVEQAELILSRLLKSAKDGGRQLDEIELLILLSAAHKLLGKDEEARDCFCDALSAAEQEKIIGCFVEEKESTRPVLMELLQDTACVEEKGISPVFIRYILSVMQSNGDDEPAIAAVNTPGGSRIPDEMLSSPLKGREVEVLRLLAKGMSNKEIAEELILGVNTIRWYLKNIYLKLDVHNRTQAVSFARELGILD